MKMPEVDRSVLDRRAQLIARLRQVVPGEGVIVDDDELRAYETTCRGRTALRASRRYGSSIRHQGLES